MSNTPRTDNAETDYIRRDWGSFGSKKTYPPAVNASFAKQLEKELQSKQWQPISTAPKDGTVILGMDTSGGVQDVAWVDEEWDDFHDNPTYRPDHWTQPNFTHWMTLTSPAT